MRRAHGVPLAAVLLLAPFGVAALACAPPVAELPAESPAAAVTAEPTLLVVREGFAGPEAVRYDPDQDLHFVGNFNGAGDAADDNGFISRLAPDGTIESLRFIDGADPTVTLHAPRGMALHGDTLWVADVGAVRAFHRRTGAPIRAVDFSARDHGFLNDIAIGPDGALYVTDTGRDRVYRIHGADVQTVIADSALGGPNGITWDAARGRFIIVPYFRGHTLHAWSPGATTLMPAGSSTGGRFDGVEVLPGGALLVASQTDSSLHLFSGGTGRPVVQTGGRPADIGVDTRRMRVAVPFISRNAVELWQLPPWIAEAAP